jgi:two-component system, sensor histidine kinase
LGLVISRELVEMMGGYIGLSKRLDDAPGAVFYFELPLRAAECAAGTQSNPDKAHPRAADPTTMASSPLVKIPALVGRRILLVEDNPALAALTEDVLRQVGCEVVVVSEGEAAIAEVGTRMKAGWGPYFDVILMDCRLPGMDGIKTAGLIRDTETANGLGKLPIIALTANAFDWDRDACLAAGMTDFLSKPYTAPQLLDVLVRAVGRPHQ